MRFYSGYPNARFVVLPRQAQYDPVGRRIGQTPGIQVRPDEFGVIDTDILAMGLGWNDEQKRKVDEYLITHKDFGRKMTRDGRVEINGVLQNEQVFILWFNHDQSLAEAEQTYGDILQRNRYWVLWKEAGLPIGSAEEGAVRICAFKEDTPPYMACTSHASEGSDYCSFHGEVSDIEDDVTIEPEPQREPQRGKRAKVTA